MQNQNQILEDLSRLMSSVAGTVAGVGREAQSRIRDQFREIIGDDYVTREEFDAVKKLASDTRAELEELKASLIDKNNK